MYFREDLHRPKRASGRLLAFALSARNSFPPAGNSYPMAALNPNVVSITYEWHRGC